MTKATIDEKALSDGYEAVSEVMAFGQYRAAVRAYESSKASAPADEPNTGQAVKRFEEWAKNKPWFNPTRTSGIHRYFDEATQAAYEVWTEREPQPIAQPPAQQPAGVDDATLLKALDAEAIYIEPENDDGFSSGTRMVTLNDAVKALRPYLHPQPAQQEVGHEEVTERELAGFFIQHCPGGVDTIQLELILRIMRDAGYTITKRRENP